MIIGRDIMRDLGIDEKFSTETIEWDDSQIPMKDSDADPQESYFIKDSAAVEDATERLRNILDAKYEAANLHEVCEGSTHLSKEEQQKLYALLS
jgi:hypothetical protein